MIVVPLYANITRVNDVSDFDVEEIAADILSNPASWRYRVEFVYWDTASKDRHSIAFETMQAKEDFVGHQTIAKYLTSDDVMHLRALRARIDELLDEYLEGDDFLPRQPRKT